MNLRDKDEIYIDKKETSEGETVIVLCVLKHGEYTFNNEVILDAKQAERLAHDLLLLAREIQE